jgi:hypothetical protein
VRVTHDTYVHMRDDMFERDDQATSQPDERPQDTVTVVKVAAAPSPAR